VTHPVARAEAANHPLLARLDAEEAVVDGAACGAQRIHHEADSGVALQRRLQLFSASFGCKHEETERELFVKIGSEGRPKLSK